MKRASIVLLFALLAIALLPAHAQSFSLVTPSGALLIRDLEGDLIQGFRWTPAAGASSYELKVFKISNIPRDTPLGEVFSQAVATSSCNSDVCIYTPNGGQLALMDRGRYAWTVVADVGGPNIEAANGPFLFSYEPESLSLIPNGDFENNQLSPWKGINLTADKLKAGAGESGGRAFLFKGKNGENSKLKQSINVRYYGIDNADTMTLSATYMAPNANLSAKVMVKMVYTAESGQKARKVTMNLIQSANFTTMTHNLFPDAHIEKLVLTIQHKSSAGKLTLDAVQLILP